MQNDLVFLALACLGMIGLMFFLLCVAYIETLLEERRKNGKGKN